MSRVYYYQSVFKMTWICVPLSYKCLEKGHMQYQSELQKVYLLMILYCNFFISYLMYHDYN